MSKNINTCDFVGMKKNKGKSNGFKSLVQEVKRKQKAEEIVKAIQKIQNEPKQKEQKQSKRKHFKTYANQEHNINHDIVCDEQAKNDAGKEIRLQQLEEIYLEHQAYSSGEEYEEFPDFFRRKEEDEYEEKPLPLKTNKYCWSTIQNKDADLETHEDREARIFDNVSFHDWHYGYSAAPIVDDFVSESMDGFEVINHGTNAYTMSDSEEEEERKQTNEAIYDYVCGNLTDDEDEVLEPIVPKHYEFESRIYDLEHKLSYAQESIYQLLGGLYNHETQRELLKSYTNFLYTGNNYLERDVSESIWPTTRQGDENAERIEKLEKDNALLKEKLEATQITVYNLLGGLYNQNTQNSVLTKNIDRLFAQNQDVPYEKHEENIWPTTRQGDENEERIKKLEENIDILVKKLKKGKPLHRFYRKLQKK